MYKRQPLHPGEHCISKVKAYQTVTKDSIPYTRAVSKIAEISKATIQNIVDSTTRTNSHKVEGILYETDVAFYFLSPNYVNCHRLGYALRNRSDTDRINIVTPTARYTYTVSYTHLDVYKRQPNTCIPDADKPANAGRKRIPNINNKDMIIIMFLLLLLLFIELNSPL